MNNLGDLLDWLAASAGTPTDAIAAAKSAALRDGPDKTDRLFGEAVELREAIYRICSALAAGRTGAEVDLAALNRALALAPARERLAPVDRTYGWAASGFDLSAPALLAPVLWSAADLLTRADRSRLRRCANDRCLWLFIDQSKTGTRRWCDMSSCGNRAKAHRHYLKSKAG